MTLPFHAVYLILSLNGQPLAETKTPDFAACWDRMGYAINQLGLEAHCETKLIRPKADPRP